MFSYVKKTKSLYSESKEDVLNEIALFLDEKKKLERERTPKKSLDGKRKYRRKKR